MVRGRGSHTPASDCSKSLGEVEAMVSLDLPEDMVYRWTLDWSLLTLRLVRPSSSSDNTLS